MFCNDLVLVLHSCGFLGSFANGSTSVMGTVVRFDCDPGFNLDGPKSLECNSSGALSNDKPSCRGIIES